LLCAGCAGSVLQSNAEAPEVYRLSAPALTPAAEALPLALSVARPRAPEALDTDRIAMVQPSHGFDYFAGIRWAEPAPRMLQQLQVQALSADGRFAAVVAAPSRVPAELLLDVELRRFEAVDLGGETTRVDVELLATLVDQRTGKRVASFPAAGTAQATQRKRGAVIDAFQAATSEAVRAVVDGTRSNSANLVP
jgi:cholesterol transport system auxiliary component